MLLFDDVCLQNSFSSALFYKGFIYTAGLLCTYQITILVILQLIIVNGVGAFFLKTFDLIWFLFEEYILKCCRPVK